MSVLSRRLFARLETASSEANLARKKAYDSAYKLLQILWSGWMYRYERKRCKEFEPEEVYTPRICEQLQSLQITSSEELDGVAVAIVVSIRDVPNVLKLVFEQLRYKKVSTIKGEHKYDKTLKQALMEVLFNGFDKIINFKRQIERVAGKYRGPVEKKNKWIQKQMEANLPSLRQELLIKLITPFIKEGIVTEDDVYMLLDKLFNDLNEISLYCVFELLDNFGMFLDYGEVSFSMFAYGYDSKKDATLNPKLSPYFTKLSTVIEENRTSCSISPDMVNVIKSLIRYRDDKWNSTSLLKRPYYRGEKL